MPFSTILGQKRAVSLLTRALQSDRLAHAYLFMGPDGVGKTSLALDMAALLFCHQPQHEVPCGICPGCLKFSSGNHPDFFRVRPDGAAIKIDQIRELKKILQFPPLEGMLRIVLLEEVQTMRREAGNSLLKILEEPPPDNLFLLISNTMSSMLPTIVSRCQLIPFTFLPQRLAAEIIRMQRPELEEEKAIMLATLTDGCPGQALTIEADEIAHLYHRLVKAMLMSTKTPAERVEEALAFASELPENEQSFEHLLHLLRIFLKNAMTADVSVSDCSPESFQARERWNLQELSAKMKTIDLIEQALARNCNRALSGEVLLLNLFDCSHFSI